MDWEAFLMSKSLGILSTHIFWAVWLLCLACVALAFAYHNYGLMINDRPKIVFAQETKVKREPNLRSNEAFILNEDTKVQV